MHNVFKWKLHKVLHSPLLPIFSGAGVLYGIIFPLVANNSDFINGIEFMQGATTNATSLLVLAAGIFCAISINHDIVSRQASVAIMAGSTKGTVLFVESFFYLVPLMIFIVTSALTSFITGTALTRVSGIESVTAGFFNFFWLIVYLLIIAASFSICIPLTLVIKREAVCGAACFALILTLHSITESFFQLDSAEAVMNAIKLLQFTSFGQLFISAGCDSPAGLAIAFGVAVVTLLVVYELSLLIFKKMELK